MFEFFLGIESFYAVMNSKDFIIKEAIFTDSHIGHVYEDDTERMQKNDGIQLYYTGYAEDYVAFHNAPISILPFYQARKTIIGSNRYTNVYENNIGMLEILGNTPIDEKIFRLCISEDSYTFSTAIKNINKTIYPATAFIGEYRMKNLL